MEKHREFYKPATQKYNGISSVFSVVMFMLFGEINLCEFRD